MDKNTFELIDAINREGIDNSQWALCEDIEDTALYFGTEESVPLDGRYVCIYDTLRRKPTASAVG